LKYKLILKEFGIDTFYQLFSNSIISFDWTNFLQKHKKVMGFINIAGMCRIIKSKIKEGKILSIGNFFFLGRSAKMNAQSFEKR
jgi:hypothetical protein